MQDATSKKLIELLEPRHPDDLRVAAARVLGEVGSRSAELHEALSRAMDDPSAAVRLQALSALGQLRIEQALPELLARIQTGGEEAEQAAQAVARMGAKGTQALQRLMAEVAPGLRRRLAAALAIGGTPTANTAAVDTLLDKDPGVITAAVSSLIGQVPSLTPSQRRALADRVLELLKPGKGKTISAISESSLLRLLAAIADPRGENPFWQRTSPEHPPELRAAALVALGTLAERSDRKHIEELVQCGCDRDFRIAAPALMILKTMPAPERSSIRDWLRLFDAPHPAVRRFAIEKLADLKDPGVAKALLAQLDHPDQSLRDEAAAGLGKTAPGRELLRGALAGAPTPEAAWILARIAARFASLYGDAFAKLFKQAAQFLDADDRRWEPLLFLLRQIDARSLRDRLEERAVELRKKKRYPQALMYFRLLARDAACSEDMRFELAACGVKLSDHNLAVESRSSDPALQQFARLLRSSATDPLERIKQAKWLAPEDLFYLGFHFSEAEGPDRQFGAEALRLAIKRSPRSKTAKEAKAKLRRAGLG